MLFACRCHTEVEVMKGQVLEKVKLHRYLAWRQKGVDLEGVSIEGVGKGALAGQDALIVADASCRIAGGEGRPEVEDCACL